MLGRFTGRFEGKFAAFVKRFDLHYNENFDAHRALYKKTDELKESIVRVETKVDILTDDKS